MSSKTPEGTSEPHETQMKSAEVAKPADLVAELADLHVAEEYQEWKESVPVEVRRTIEGALKSAPEKPLAESSLPLVGQYLREFRKAMSGGLSDAVGVDRRVANLLKPLAAVKTKTGGVIDVFRTMADPHISWSLRRKLYELQMRSSLEWLAEKDLEEAKKKNILTPEEERKDDAQTSSLYDSDLPDQSDEARSSMESGTEKREGQPKAKFTVAPFWGGYFKQKILDSFDSSGRWTASEEKKLESAPETPLDNLRARIIFGKVRGGARSLALPLPYNWEAQPDSLECASESAKVRRDQNGLWYLIVDEPGVFEYNIKIAPRQVLAEEIPSAEMNITGDVSEEARDLLKKIQSENRSKIKQAREIVKAVKSRLKYSNNPDVWKKYTAKNSADFFEKVWQLKEADCFAANTLAIRLLKEAGIPCRFISGHFVKEKNEQNQAVLHAGSGHAWLEVWDAVGNHWVRLDATPKGDPTVDEEEQEKDLNDENGEGDFGEDDEVMSEKDLKQKIKDLKKEQGAGGGAKKKTRERSREDMEKERFATEAGCSAEQAAEFLRALERVRAIRDEQGRPISDLLKDEWRKIVVARKVESADYRGPVRMDEGDRLEDPVSAFIDIRSQQYNPTGFERIDKQTREKHDFGGLNIFFSFDLSGSMDQPDPVTGRKKSDVQRDVALLFVDSLMQCAYISRQSGGESDLLPIKIMATLASSRGQRVLPLTDRWGPAEQWKLYSALIRLASGGTPTHETLDIIDSELVAEQEALRKKRVTPDKMPINYVAEISDGSPDYFDETEARHVGLKKKGVVIRSFCIGDSSASADAAPPLSSFSELPGILTKDITGEFKKLNPRRIKT